MDYHFWAESRGLYTVLTGYEEARIRTWTLVVKLNGRLSQNSITSQICPVQLGSSLKPARSVYTRLLRTRTVIIILTVLVAPHSLLFRHR